MKLLDGVRSRFKQHAAIWWAIVLGLLLTLPALGNGFVIDDIAQRAMLADDAPEYLSRGPLDLYRFMPASETWREAAVNAGTHPWYADPELHIELWRPLSSLTLYLDHRLWRDSAPLAHAHSLVWYGLLLLMVGLLYRRLFASAKWVAVLAALLFAVDEAHGFPVAWIANRHEVIALAWGVGALVAHVKWRQASWRPGALIAPVALACGLFSGETALSVTAYLFAFALCLDRGRLAQRALSLLPCAVVSVAWLVAYSVLGFGAGGSGHMIDPAREPLHYLAELPQRLALLLQGQLTPVMPDLGAFFSGNAALVFVLVAAAVLLAITAVLWPLLRRDRLAAFFAVGMVVSALPVCATFPSDRLLFAIGIGGMGLVAQLIARFSDSAELDSYWSRRSVRLLTVIFIIFHVVLAPLLLPLRSLQPRMMQAGFDAAFHSLDRLGDLEGRTLIIVNGPDFMYTTYAATTRQKLGLSVPARVQTLATGLHALRVTRVDDSTLRLEADDGFMSAYMDRAFRHPQRPFTEGATVALSGARIEVTSVTPDGRPAALRCTFEGPLDDSSRAWTYWSANGYVPFELPAVGATVTLAAIEPAELAGFTYEPDRDD